MLVVFGARGGIGRRLGERLTALGRPWRGAPPSSVCDLADARAVARFLDTCGPGPLRVINLAVVGKFVDNSLDGLRRNLAMTAGLIEALRDRAVASLVQVSSLDVYGARPPCPLTEDSPCAPADWYGLAKLVSEQMPALEPSLAPVLTVARLPGVCAPQAGDRSVLGTFWRLVRSGEAVTVHGDGAARRDFVCRDDVCDLLAALAGRDTGLGRLNVGSGQSLAIREVLTLLGRACGREPRLDFAPAQERTFDIVIDISKLRAALPHLVPRPLSAWIDAFPGALAQARGRDNPAA